ncbi:hypothetical protein SDC9_191580 [bioreactor metagenome]|uniref:Uncharacterized protein n=1 Tax=bioreactor metagenome TaxID=1076179 RepID=A0A645I0P7_9ZZZZ
MGHIFKGVFYTKQEVNCFIHIKLNFHRKRFNLVQFGLNSLPERAQFLFFTSLDFHFGNHQVKQAVNSLSGVRTFKEEFVNVQLCRFAVFRRVIGILEIIQVISIAPRGNKVIHEPDEVRR